MIQSNPGGSRLGRLTCSARTSWSSSFKLPWQNALYSVASPVLLFGVRRHAASVDPSLLKIA